MALPLAMQFQHWSDHEHLQNCHQIHVVKHLVRHAPFNRRNDPLRHREHLLFLKPGSRGRLTVADEIKQQPRYFAKARYQQGLNSCGFGAIATEIMDAAPFYSAEEYHQQYLAKNPQGYCGLGGTGVPY